MERIKQEFEIRLYEDMDEPSKGYMIVEISKIKTYEMLQKIINFLERLRE